MSCGAVSTWTPTQELHKHRNTIGRRCFVVSMMRWYFGQMQKCEDCLREPNFWTRWKNEKFKDKNKNNLKLELLQDGDRIDNRTGDSMDCHGTHVIDWNIVMFIKIKKTICVISRVGKNRNEQLRRLFCPPNWQFYSSRFWLGFSVNRY